MAHLPKLEAMKAHVEVTIDSYLQNTTSMSDQLQILLHWHRLLREMCEYNQEEEAYGDQFVPGVDGPLYIEQPLTAPGATPARSMVNYCKFSYQVDVSGIGTEAIVRVEGSVSGEDFVNINTNYQDTKLTTSGSYLFKGDIKLTTVRFRLVSFTGGSPVLKVSLRVGN